jgi:hypothetical protein
MSYGYMLFSISLRYIINYVVSQIEMKPDRTIKSWKNVFQDAFRAYPKNR